MFQLDPDRVFPEEVATSPEYHDYVVPLCRKICAGATDAEIDEAATNLQRGIAVCVRIYQRLESERGTETWPDHAHVAEAPMKSKVGSASRIARD